MACAIVLSVPLASNLDAVSSNSRSVFSVASL